LFQEPFLITFIVILIMYWGNTSLIKINSCYMNV